jgi:hypothetical protein
MDLQAAWKKLDKSKFKVPLPDEHEINLRRKSHHPVKKLIWYFQLGLALCIIFEVAFIYLAITLPQPIVKIFLLVVVLLYVFFFVLNYRILRNIQTLYKLDSDIKSTLKNIYDSTTRMLAFQRKSAIFIYPICGTAGFLMGLSVEKDALTLIQRPSIFIALIVTLIILTPLAHLLAKWLEKVSYNKYLSQLRDIIQQLEEPS